MKQLRFFVFAAVFIFFANCKAVPVKHTNEVTLQLHKHKIEINNPTLERKRETSDIKPSAQINYEILETGSAPNPHSGNIIRTQEDLDKFYLQMYMGNKQAPKLDFSKKAVVIVFAGTFFTGGYEIKLHSAIQNGKKLHLNFYTDEPDPLQVVTQAVTNPYLVLSIDIVPETEIIVNFVF